MGRFVVDVALIQDGEWVQIDEWFATPEEALFYIQDNYQNWKVAARITNAETDEPFLVEGFLIDTPRPSFQDEIAAEFETPENVFFPELYQEMQAEQRRFLATDRAREFHTTRRRQDEVRRTRRMRAFNFTGGQNGLEVGFSNPDPKKKKKKKKKKYKVEWWKDGF